MRRRLINGFLDTVLKDVGNEYAARVSDGVAAGDVAGYVDTGSYIFNALVSGSIYGGLPSNKVTAQLENRARARLSLLFLWFVISLTLIRSGVMYFESESAISQEMIVSRGIDPKRMYIFPVATIEEFRLRHVGSLITS